VWYVGSAFRRTHSDAIVYLGHFRLVWRRASALRFRSPEGLRHYSHIEPL